MGTEKSDTIAAFERQWQKLSEQRTPEQIELEKQKIRDEGILFNVDRVYERRERDRKHKLKLAILKEKGQLTFQDLHRFR